jgi:hypothetical protein
MPWRASSVRVVRVSSHAMTSTPRRTSSERGLASARFPMGVATTYSVAGIGASTLQGLVPLSLP